MPSIGPLFEEKILIAIATIIVAGAPPGTEAMIEVLEREIERRGLRAQYISALGELVSHYRGNLHGATVYSNMSVWAFIRATPAQRAQAFLDTIGAPEL